jgi:hypothetical protein
MGSPRQHGLVANIRPDCPEGIYRPGLRRLVSPDRVFLLLEEREDLSIVALQRVVRCTRNGDCGGGASGEERAQDV